MSKSYQKINTFSRTPSPAQIASYLVIALETAFFYAFVQPHFKSQTSKIIFITLYSLSVASIIITTIICSCVDPSDDIMIECKKGNHSKFSNQLNMLLYCDYCHSYVAQNSRHCRQCDRCVQNFDHHCMWINNCVGSKNYKAFVAMIISAFANLLIFSLSAIILTAEDNWETILGFMIPTWIILAVVVVFCFLVLNLILLHIYLACKGFTTYQFIVARREEERLDKLREINERRQKEEQKMRKMLQQKKKPSNIDESRQSQKNKQTIKVVEIESEESFQKIQVKQQTMKSQSKDDTIIHPSHQKFKSEEDGVVFEEKQITEKSMGDLESKEKKQEKESSSSEESIRISQFFMRNKSFNLFINKDLPAKPHKKVMNASSIVSVEKVEKPKDKRRQKTARDKKK